VREMKKSLSFFAYRFGIAAYLSVATDDLPLMLVLLIGHIAPANPVPKRSMNRRRPIAKSSLQTIRQLWPKLFLEIRFGGLQPV